MFSFSTLRTKNIHIYLVCCCQHTLATIDIPFRACFTNRTLFIENISGVFPHLERRIYTYILSVAQPEHTCYDRHCLSSDIPFRAGIRSRTRLICCCQRTLATINISFRASITSGTRFIDNISGVFPHLERRIYTFII